MGIKEMLVEKYKLALEKSKESEKLKCHSLAIEKKIRELNNPSYKIVTLDYIWVNYFLS